MLYLKISLPNTLCGRFDGVFEAVGINGQIIRAAPQANMVIVLNSAWPREEGQTITDGWYDGWDMADSLFSAIKLEFSDSHSKQ